MKESYGEDVASHTGPELCAGAREGTGEALAGVRTGGVLSREIRAKTGAPTLSKQAEGTTARAEKARTEAGPARSETSGTFGNSPHRNWETPGSALATGAKVRVVNPFGARRR
jgi:hypothetical protein